MSTDSNATPGTAGNNDSSSRDSAPAAAKPGPLKGRGPLQVGSRRHFTSGSGPSPLSSKANPPPPPPRPAPAPVAVAPAAVPVAIEPSADPVDAPITAATAIASPAPLQAKPAPKKPKPVDPAVRDVTLPPPPPKPSRHDRMTAEMEKEMEEAFGGMSLEDVISGVAPAALRDELEAESRRRAVVVRVHNDDVFFALDGRNEGVVSARQFHTPPEVGAAFDVIVKSFNAEDGLYELIVPGASIDVSDWSDLSEGSIVDAVVTAANSGGLECTVNKLRGFIPAGQVSMYRIENFGEFVGQRLRCVVTEVNPQRRNLVLSARAVLEREKEEGREKFFAELEVGQTREGTVRKIHDFGAFVDMGGADGLIHISQLSWERVKHPSEILKEGEKIQVRIEKIDPDTRKIGLSYRNLQDHPWKNAEDKYPVGATVKGTVSRLANFGAFVKLAPGIEGLVHVSELAHYRVSQVNKVVQEGQEVEAKVLSIDVEGQRISLSLKAAIPAPVSAAKETEKEDLTPPPVSLIPKRSGPLKGGVDRPTGGEGMGLQW